MSRSAGRQALCVRRARRNATLPARDTVHAMKIMLSAFVDAAGASLIFCYLPFRRFSRIRLLSFATPASRWLTLSEFSLSFDCFAIIFAALPPSMRCRHAASFCHYAIACRRPPMPLHFAVSYSPAFRRRLSSILRCRQGAKALFSLLVFHAP